VFHNDSRDMHPLHLHRHSFEVVRFAVKPTSDIIRDVVSAPWRQSAWPAIQGSLLGCHVQEHQGFRLMAPVKRGTSPCPTPTGTKAQFEH
jgi:hypothetical protein